jgi:hypothetical protein
MHKASFENFLLDQFQIGLPPIGNTIMLCTNWRLPGGRSATQPK